MSKLETLESVFTREILMFLRPIQVTNGMRSPVDGELQTCQQVTDSDGLTLNIKQVKYEYDSYNFSSNITANNFQYI